MARYRKLNATTWVNTSGYDNNVYDNNERVIGSWFGKPLYRRTFNTNAKNCTVGWNALVTGTSGIASIKSGILCQANKKVACDVNIDQSSILECYLYRAINISSTDTLTIEYTKVGD